MPRTWRAGGIIGPTTAKQNAGAGGVEVAREAEGVADNSDEETREVRAGEARKILEAEEIADKAAGGDGAVLNRAGGARETGKIFRQSTGSRRNC